MKEYFVCSDIHGFYDAFFNALIEAGFDLENKDHMIIICGDMFDRGNQAKELLEFLIKMNKESRLVLIRGNHEDLLEDCLQEIENRKYPSQHHWHNKTVDTLSQLTEVSAYDFYYLPNISILRDKLKDYFDLISTARDYYEVGDYIFVHGWVPYVLQDEHDPSGELSIASKPIIKLDAEKFMWDYARWYNGMKEAASGIIIEGKTIVCGHWHTGWGHFNIHKQGSTQYDDFSVYYDKGIIALDACTVHSNKVNVLRIKDE